MKPAEQTPLSALRIGELIIEAGFPEGVVNILPGYGPTAGAAITRHLDVDKVAFTGSTEVGQLVMEAAVKSNLKRVTLELAARARISSWRIRIWTPRWRAHISASSSITVNAAAPVRGSSWKRRSTTILWRRAGGARENGGRWAIHSIPKTEQGPQVDSAQFDKVMGYIEPERSEGAKLVCGGDRVGNRGYFIPTDGVCRRAGRHEDRTRRDLRSGNEHHSIPQRGRGGRQASQSHKLRPSSGGVDARYLEGARHLQQRARRNRLGELLQRARSAGAVRRFQAVRNRPGTRRVRFASNIPK